MLPIFAHPLGERVTRLSLTATNGACTLSLPCFSEPDFLTASLSVSCRWISGAGDPRCAVHLVLGKSDPNNKDKYNQQSIVLVPSNTPGVNIIRPMKVQEQIGTSKYSESSSLGYTVHITFHLQRDLIAEAQWHLRNDWPFSQVG